MKKNSIPVPIVGANLKFFDYDKILDVTGELYNSIKNEQ